MKNGLLCRVPAVAQDCDALHCSGKRRLRLTWRVVSPWRVSPTYAVHKKKQKYLSALGIAFPRWIIFQCLYNLFVNVMHGPAYGCHQLAIIQPPSWTYNQVCVLTVMSRVMSDLADVWQYLCLLIWPYFCLGPYDPLHHVMTVTLLVWFQGKLGLVRFHAFLLNGELADIVWMI